MKLCRFLLGAWLSIAIFYPAWAAVGTGEFQKNNPDINKFEFARSYISALNYFANIDKRWQKVNPKKTFKGEDVQIMRGYVSYLIKDNMDLRIAKNFLSKYLDSPNLLMRKSADQFISASQMHMAINEKEKEIWDQWYAVKTVNLATLTNERAFIKAHEDLAIKRKETDASLVEATVLMSKVLKSQKNVNEQGYLLALTDKQRQTLLKRLDVFGRDTLDWGLKAGQTRTSACIAVIREILEDSIYTTLHE